MATEDGSVAIRFRNAVEFRRTGDKIALFPGLLFAAVEIEIE